MIIVMGRDDCKYCNKAKELLESVGWEYKYIDVSIHKNPHGNETMHREVLKATGEMARTVPQIFKVTTISGGTEYIGGYDDLKKHLEPVTNNLSAEDIGTFQMDL